MTTESEPLVDDLVRAARAFATLLLTEYPSGYSIEAVVAEWGPDEALSSADIAAVTRLAPLLRD